MKKTIPFYLVQGLTLAAIFSLGACTPTPIKPIVKKKQSDAVDVSKIDTKQVIQPKALKPLTQTELHQKIDLAISHQDWVQYIQLQQQIWQTADAPEQVDIEFQIWKTLNQQSLSATDTIRTQLSASEVSSAQSWAALLNAIKGSAPELLSKLQHLSSTYPDAIYHANVLPELIAILSEQAPVQTIAVLLPFQGKYKQVSAQIRSGMLQAFFASNQTTALKFYDSSNLETLENIYQQAKLEGADFIIGPLRKAAIEQISELADKNTLVLNKTEPGNYTQFSFKSANEVSQMIAHFKALNFQNIGILSNDSTKDQAFASDLQAKWQLDTSHTAVLSLYPDHSPKLRKALGGLINEDSSKARYNNLRWITRQSLSFFPRTRQDFDAIVIIDDSRRLSVFKPQFSFFEMNTPLYGTAQLTPKKFQDRIQHPDLVGVQFLTYPASLQPGTLNSKFEAFGWDSFQVAKNMHILKIGSYLSATKTGQLTRQDHRIVQSLIWAKYDSKGELKPVPALIAPLPNQQTQESVIEPLESTPSLTP